MFLRRTFKRIGKVDDENRVVAKTRNISAGATPIAAKVGESLTPGPFTVWLGFQTQFKG